MPSQLTPEEREALLNATRRAQAVQATKNANAPVGVRQEVDDAEYVHRLQAAHKQDMSLLTETRERKIKKASTEWAKLVGPTFADAETQIPSILERVNRMQQKQGLHKTSIVLYGDKYGRGKTWNAYAYLNALVHTGVLLPGQIFFGTESSTIARIAGAGFEKADALRDLKHPSHKAFYIDDVGLAYYFKKDHREEAWYELVDHVYTRRLTLILTTNLDFTPNGLGSWIGGRSFDRLRTLVGEDGALMLNGVNRRDYVYQENEKQYREGSNRS